MPTYRIPDCADCDAQRTVDGQRCPKHPIPAAGSTATPGRKPSGSVRVASSASSDSSAYLFGGIAIVIVGMLIASLAIPSTTVSSFGTEESGNSVVFMLGLLLAALGYTMSLIGVIAKGVALGGRATREV